MTPNWIGVVAACATFFSVWLGHVSVRAELGWYRFNPHKRLPPFAIWIKRWPTPKL